jgi:hypothetical protein
VTHVSGFAQIRNVFRYAYFVQMTVALLAISGLSIVGSIFRRRFFRRRGLCSVVMSALCLLLILDTRSTRMTLKQPPELTAHLGWIRFLQNQIRPGKAVLCLPFEQGNTVTDFELTTSWMYYATFHKAPLVNGYSGFFDAEYFELRKTLKTPLLAENAFLEMHQKGVDYVVLVGLKCPWISDVPGSFSSVQLVLEFRDSCGIDVYRIVIPVQPAADAGVESGHVD